MARQHKGSWIVRMASPFLGVLIAMGIFGMVWLRSEIISTEYAIGELESRISEAVKQRQDLEARLSSSMSVREVGQRGLGLDFPDRQKVFFVLRDDSQPVQTASLKEGSARGVAER